MLQDIGPSVYNNEYRPREPKEGDGVLVYGKGTVLVRMGDASFEIPRFPQLPATKDDFLFCIDDVAYFGYRSDEFDSTLEGFSKTRLNDLYRKNPRTEAFACATGHHIVSWKNYHNFCGVCGSALVPSDKERALVCPACGHTIYPDIHPAVNIAIRNGDRLLMVKQNRNPNMPFVLVAGFVEVGETAEDTVRREPMEEVGLKVKNVTYFGSQPWGSAGNLQIGFYCDVDGDPTPKADGSEILEARWFERSEVPTALGTHSITGALIDAFRRGEI